MELYTKFWGFIFLSGAGLDNGQWHSVSLSVKRNRISVRVDNDVTSSAHVSIPLQIYSGDVFYFGGEILLFFYIGSI